MMVGFNNSNYIWLGATELRARDAAVAQTKGYALVIADNQFGAPRTYAR
jgi:hypothetical protein